MATTLQEFRHANPGVYIAGESGKWLLVVCHQRAWRFDSYFEAQAKFGDECGVRMCSGPRYHQIIELGEAAKPFKPSRSFRAMVAADD
jgi:hypothetical protein